MKEKILFLLSKIVVNHYTGIKSELIFAKTQDLAKIISRSYNLDLNKFRAIPLGSDPELFKHDSKARILLRKKLGLSENDIVIVYSGKINPSKNIDVLIKASSSIIIRNNKVKLLIIGEGEVSYMRYLKKPVSELRIAENVIFQPWVNSLDLPYFYSACDIGVWPGLSSISIVDAASTGLPLVIARYPVETYAIENGNGFTFKIGDTEELRKCLEILIYDDKLRREMGHRSRLLVEQKLNWQRIALLYMQAYISALNKS